MLPKEIEFKVGEKYSYLRLGSKRLDRVNSPIIQLIVFECMEKRPSWSGHIFVFKDQDGKEHHCRRSNHHNEWSPNTSLINIRNAIHSADSNFKSEEDSSVFFSFSAPFEEVEALHLHHAASPTTQDLKAYSEKALDLIEKIKKEL